MPIELPQLISDIVPEKTVLFFGSGSSVPSHAPSVTHLCDRLSRRFSLETGDYTLRDLTSIIELRTSRLDLITYLRTFFYGIRPSGGLLNLPSYGWKCIYTTNYDDLIEQSYTRAGVRLNAISSDFDFSNSQGAHVQKLFKLHGTIEKDDCDGHRSRIILTDQDYDKTHQYREVLWNRFASDISDAHLIVIGYSLSDPHIKDVVDRAAKVSATTGVGRVTLLLYTPDPNRAALYEMRGMRVCFGGIDEFAAALAKRKPDAPIPEESEDVLALVPELRPITIEVDHILGKAPDVSSMFNGWPANYSDVEAGLTFERTVAEAIENALLTKGRTVSVIVGASGVGKTTAARQAVLKLKSTGVVCWEHKTEVGLDPAAWYTVATYLHGQGKIGCLMIDEAHSHLQSLNELVDKLVVAQLVSLKIVCATTRNLWNPRIKSPNIYRHGHEEKLSQLSSDEIGRLLNLLDSNNDLRKLTEASFSGFSRLERRRRLVERCEADMFVCLKNIFASEKFDDIILREYASLQPEFQSVYKMVAAMESAGIRVHRQLVIRLLSIPAASVQAILVNLTDIVSEYMVSERDGIYAWKGRHAVIVAIIAKYKYSNAEQLAKLFSEVIDCISPAYEIEIRTIRELCNVDSGLQKIPDKEVQNTLLRKMISVAPGERVPRHRLIRNLIDLGSYEKAETEIRIFDKDFKSDGAVMRYKITLLTARAVNTPGLMEEDRLAILDEARETAAYALSRYPDHKYIHGAHCELGIEIYKRTKDLSVYDYAMDQLKSAEERAGDPELSKLIAKYERLIAGKVSVELETVDDAVE
ncbi:SIR2 family protein [Pseudomonas sp. 35 E 8]|uniref:SIR2 family protein n=1 Tax=Pseudomonas sp. 35 E 8 TaxID=1844103 RepID=UPI0008122954|nr:SIR2 family protein [Pseudomonas sp. 35 E 8]CRM18912.1 hypothetical protein [Pseudomonas sp. 35 E 8]